MHTRDEFDPDAELFAGEISEATPCDPEEGGNPVRRITDRFFSDPDSELEAKWKTISGQVIRNSVIAILPIEAYLIMLKSENFQDHNSIASVIAAVGAQVVIALIGDELAKKGRRFSVEG